jgi:hypothetical protein
MSDKPRDRLAAQLIGTLFTEEAHDELHNRNISRADFLDEVEAAYETGWARLTRGAPLPENRRGMAEAVLGFGFQVGSPVWFIARILEMISEVRGAEMIARTSKIAGLRSATT